MKNGIFPSQSYKDSIRKERKTILVNINVIRLCMYKVIGDKIKLNKIK